MLNQTPKEKAARAPARAPAAKDATQSVEPNKRRQFSARSSATEAQIFRLIELLRVGARHTYELRARGISHPAGRVRDMLKRGYAVAVSRITAVDSEGFLHSGVARYSLDSEP